MCTLIICRGEAMKNITLSMDEDLINKGREFARRHNTSLNNLIRDILKQKIGEKPKNWIDECFQLMDLAKVNSKGKKWAREDLYDI
jgi:metal-responsive CopG/Arc/MetJ family transcriptional regulator